MGRKEAKEEGDVIIESFKDVLRNGYDQDKDQNLLKAKYIDKLNEACQIIDVVFARCSAQGVWLMLDLFIQESLS